MLLLDALKAKLKITWDDEDTNLSESIASGQAYINGLTKTILNFDTPGEPKTLLLEYCRYDYNNAIEYFEENFGSRIMRLQYSEEVKEYQAAHPEEVI